MTHPYFDFEGKDEDAQRYSAPWFGRAEGDRNLTIDDAEINHLRSLSANRNAAHRHVNHLKIQDSMSYEGNSGVKDDLNSYPF